MSEEPVSADVEEPPPRRGRRTWPWIVLLSVVLVPTALFALWAVITLHWSYSEGARTGYVLKFSEKGWLCKTWEGELSMTTTPGTAPEKWEFTVRSDSIAQEIQRLQGQQVSLAYEEHKGVPTACFGDTRYFVTQVRAVGSGASTPASPPVTSPPAPTPAPAPPR